MVTRQAGIPPCEEYTPVLRARVRVPLVFRAVADGAAGVFYPGERSAALAEGRAAEGVPVVPKVWRRLVEDANRLGIAPPGTRPFSCGQLKWMSLRSIETMTWSRTGRPSASRR
ncbi:hypothetical protein [Streptomyces sp. NPDC098781]|uniref:hypothetical protein n=1 Tax=Streptomyces sp. NPDC098781 TaxID=3366097 RepID=UPI003803B2D4